MIISHHLSTTLTLVQFTFYASYHNNLINQLIHISCVWPILWTALVMLQYTPTMGSTPSSLPPWLVLNAALLAMVIWTAFYLGLEVKNRRSLGGVGLLSVRQGSQHSCDMACYDDN